jgi:hypothetical protein
MSRAVTVRVRLAVSPIRRVSRIQSHAGDSCWLYIWILLEELVSIRRLAVTFAQLGCPY